MRGILNGLTSELTVQPALKGTLVGELRQNNRRVFFKRKNVPIAMSKNTVGDLMIMAPISEKENVTLIITRRSAVEMIKQQEKRNGTKEKGKPKVVGS